VGELKSDIAILKDVEVTLGRIIEGPKPEEAGPTPFPSITDLRSWDLKLLERYKPFTCPSATSAASARSGSAT